MNAATSVVTTRSPYIARFSMTLPQVSAPMATWAAKCRNPSGRRGEYQIVRFGSGAGPTLYSVWMKRKLVQRLHNDSKLPVEHVVLEEAAV